ncbi:hypothetical protein [Nocardia sp. NBC_00403]|uniref:hypothetical protein n=1 Tax=Nocardia sp. NBC_00403 TaxID=2975990 RepID=UPI002E23E9E9
MQVVPTAARRIGGAAIEHIRRVRVWRTDEHRAPEQGRYRQQCCRRLAMREQDPVQRNGIHTHTLRAEPESGSNPASAHHSEQSFT